MNCLHCGSELARKAYGPPPKYCSAKCRVAASNLRAKADGRYTEQLRAQAEKRAVSREQSAKPCPYCGDLMLNLKRVQCGKPDCKRKYQAERMRTKYPHLLRTHRSRRRARVRGVRVEAFTHAEIYERDDWRCGICGQEVRQDLVYPHPESVSLDHIVPLAGGGEHVRENVQCSHLRCNLRKQDRPAARPLPIG